MIVVNYNGVVSGLKDKTLLRAFCGTAGLQLVGRGLSVISGILFARLLGPEDFGRYSFVFSIMMLAVMPVSAGMPQLIIRELGSSRFGKDGAYIKGLLRWSTLYILIVSTLVILGLVGLTQAKVWEPRICYLVLIAAVLVPFRGLLEKQGAVFNGLQRPELAQLPVLILTPLLAIIVVAVGYLFRVHIDSQFLMYAQVVTYIVSFCAISLVLNKVLARLELGSSYEFKIKQWHASLLPFTVLVIVGTMNNELATVFLGFLGSKESVAYFKVSMQAIVLLALGLQAVNAVSGPRIARLYKQGNMAETQKVLTQSVRLSVASSVPFALLLIVFGKPLVTLLFGAEYIPAAKLISILCIGQIVNVMMGSVGLVLNMTGNERYSLKALLITLSITILLLFLLIPRFQAVGAAVAVSCSLIIWNLIMAYDVYKLTKLKTWIRF